MASALSYCALGCRANDDEHPVERPDDEETDDPSCDVSIAVGVVRDAQALGLGISLADAKTMTRSALQEVIFKAYQMKDIEVSKSIKQECLGDYMTTKQSIIDRL